MNTLAKVFVATAAVVVVAVLGINLLPGTGTTGSQPSPSPTVAPTASPQPTLARVPGSGPIEAGTYLVSDGKSSIGVTIPAGWDAAANGRDIRKHRNQPNEVIFSVYSPDINVYSDACATDATPPRTGPTADDLVAALHAQQNSVVSEPAQITISGRPGVRVGISAPETLDLATCTDGLLRIWSGTTGNNYLALGQGTETAPVSIVETSSGRIVFSAGNEPQATAPDLAELQAMVDSIQIEPAP